MTRTRPRVRARILFLAFLTVLPITAMASNQDLRPGDRLQAEVRAGTMHPGIALDRQAP